MSLMRSLSAGISGMQGFQTKMDVIGNNIANVNTAGFKASQVNFAELVSQNMGKPDARFGSAPSLYNQVGLGSRVSSISRDFSQGAVTSTNIKTDLAIQGNGFFLVNDGQQNMVTRAGNFKFNAAGYLVTDSGLNVRGFNANPDGKLINGGTSEDIRLNFDDVYAPNKTTAVNLAGNLNANTSKARSLAMNSAFTTDTGALATATTAINSLSQTTTDLVAGDQIVITATNNAGTATTSTYTYAAGDTLDALLTSINTAFGTEGDVTLEDGKFVLKSEKLGTSSINLSLAMQTAPAPTGKLNFSSFSTTVEGATNSQTISNTVYDSQGEAHTLLLNLQQDNYNTWTIRPEFLNGESITDLNGDATAPFTPVSLTFDAEGNIITPASGDLSISFDPGNGAGTMTFKVKLDNAATGKITQYDGSNSANFVSQDGYSKGELTDFFVDANGLIVGTYSNGKSKSLAQLGIATVANNNALEHVGNGLFSVNSSAGDLIVGSAVNLPDTTINAGFLESSNVDLAVEFTEMIVAQRAYQSAARVITTSDQLLGEVVQLKR